MSASDKQIGGTHYADLPTEMQPWNVLSQWLTPEEYRGWQKGNAIVYLARERNKGGDQDIKKALHHLERLIEEFDKDAPTAPTKAATDDGGWIEWRGGDCPVPPASCVLVRLRCGTENEPGAAGEYRWKNLGLQNDIIAYRVVQP